MPNLTYSEILNLRKEFLRSGGASGRSTTGLDSPAHKYFKIFFHFYNGSSDNAGNGMESGGLLAPFFDVSGGTKSDSSNIDNITPENETLWRQHTCAWTYLKLNGEEERAEQLKTFIRLLSGISSDTPWYFQSIDGLEGSIERKAVNEDEYKIEGDNKLSIKCLCDSVDDRIGTLLDLYRSIIFSHSMKRFVLPSNLRKFDMSVLIFDQQNPSIHYSGSTGDSEMGIYDNYGSEYKSSYKYFEFHNCEIDYSSSKSGFSGVDNAEGLDPVYTIDIKYDDMYENRYNANILMNIGDFIEIDMSTGGIKSLKEADKSSQEQIYSSGQHPQTKQDPQPPIDPSVLDGHYGSSQTRSGFIGNAVGQVVGTAVNRASNLVKTAVLGNLHTLSVTDLVTDASQLLKGDVMGTYRKFQQKSINEDVRTGGNGSLGTLFGEIGRNISDNTASRFGSLADEFRPNAKNLFEGGSLSVGDQNRNRTARANI